ncbi:hypothetical protein N0V83_009138 [Neocucurbitaria cava]|uniref:Uncharacterized protein n=1 Tax=Neocucurbitaria cava TaxID=798079 RepID=A0A9W8Y0Z0_9PLEO|nr:hypothetical protein N0V83_009138 [Neocucurbitaria cava]
MDSTDQPNMTLGAYGDASAQDNNQISASHFQENGNAPVQTVPHYHLPPSAAQYHQRHHEDQPVMNLQPQPALTPRFHFLHDLPAHDYVLPAGGPINVTMVEIIAILPNWFRNRNIALRFQNNGINAGIHLAILQEYRHLNLTTLIEFERAREQLSSQYRKTMRDMIVGWTKAKHQAPGDWNKSNMLVNDFLPEAARQPGYVAPPSIPFKHLTFGLKKLPEGHDAADLTRALDFCLNNQKTNEHGQGIDFMFPDDLQDILNYIGRTVIINAHTDPHAIRRYGDIVKAAHSAKVTKLAEQRQQKKVTEQQATANAYQNHVQRFQAQARPQYTFGDPGHRQLDVQYAAMQPTGMGNPVRYDSPQAYPNGYTYQQGDGFGMPYAHNLHQPPFIQQEAAAAVASQLGTQPAGPSPSDFPEIPDVCRMPDLERNGSNGAPTLDEENIQNDVDQLFTMEDMADFLAPHQDIDFFGLGLPPKYAKYSPLQILRDCTEGDDEIDNGDLARASRWARGYEVIDFTVSDVDWVINMLDTADGEPTE